MNFIFEEDFVLADKTKDKGRIEIFKAKVFVVDDEKQLSLFKDNKAKLVQIGVMTKEVATGCTHDMYYFESPNPQINAVYNRSHISFKKAKSWALKHLHSLDWGQILEGGV